MNRGNKQPFYGKVLILTPQKQIKPGGTVKVNLYIRAKGHLLLKHVLAGYLCKSISTLLPNDIHLSSQPADPDTPIHGIEEHFLVNSEREIFKGHLDLEPNNYWEHEIEVEVPDSLYKYESCDKHTFPFRNTLFDKDPEDRWLPPNGSIRVSDQTVLELSHRIEATVTIQVGEEFKLFNVVSPPLNYKQSFDRIPRNWNHLVKSRKGKDYLLLDQQKKVVELNLDEPLPPGDSKAKMVCTFKGDTELETPFGSTKRLLFLGRRLSDQLKVSLELPLSVIKRKVMNRKVTLLQVNIGLKRKNTVIGGVYAELDGPEDIQYRKQRRTYDEQKIVGQRYLNAHLLPEFDKENGKAVFDIPEQELRWLLCLSGKSVKACNYGVDFTLSMSVRIRIGHGKVVEFVDDLPIFYGPEPVLPAEVKPKEENKIIMVNHDPEAEVGDSRTSLENSNANVETLSNTASRKRTKLQRFWMIWRRKVQGPRLRI